MSESERMVVWTCDRCGKQAVIIAADQPTNWSGFILIKPPRSEDASARPRQHLCRECTNDFKIFMETPVHDHDPIEHA